MKKEVIVPTELNDITLGQMQMYERVQNDLSDEERHIKALEIFCELERSLIHKIPNKVLHAVTGKLSNTLQQEPQFQATFTMNGIKYGFVPNLDELTFGEFVDIENYQSDFGDMHKLMSVLYRPVTEEVSKKYLIEPYKANVDATIMKQMPVGVAFGAQVFFWSLGIDLLKSTMKSLAQEAEDILRSTDLLKNGNGFQAYMDSLRGTLDELTRSRPYPSINV